MRYAQIRKLDISDGTGIGVSLFVQGCHFHCKNCFNESTWDFDGGKEFTKQIEEHFLNLAQQPHVQRVSILGGEPLAPENLPDVIELCKKIYEYGNRKIWVYTGYTFEHLSDSQKEILKYIDVLVDGQYVDELRDLKLNFRGSSNQHIWMKDNKRGEWKIVDFDILGNVLEGTAEL